MDDREWRCLRKQAYATEAEAQKKALKSREITGEHWSAYRCDYSEPGNPHFHIGHTPPGKVSQKEQKKRWRQRKKEQRRAMRAETAGDPWATSSLPSSGDATPD